MNIQQHISELEQWKFKGEHSNDSIKFALLIGYKCTQFVTSDKGGN